MKLYTLLFLVTSLLIISCSDSDNPVKSNEDALKAEATDFSLKVVECYITQDTKVFEEFLPEILYVVDPSEPPYETSNIILDHYLSSYDYSNYTIQQYKDTYDYEILNYEQYSNNYASWVGSLEYWHPSNKDYLFFGHIPREGKTPFMDSRILIFLVSNESGDWKLKAIQ